MSTAIELDPEPRSVRAARAWVVDELRALGRDDLSDAAELGVSELVTNAILHADPPIVVRVGGTPTHPRVEVHDNSVAPPTPRPLHEDDRFLATVGRGLGIVAMYSSTWGADVSAQGKVVWFEPSAEPVLGADMDDADLSGRVFSLSDVVDARLATAEDATDRVTILLLGMPVQVFAHYRVWYHEMRRELRLLALNHGTDYPIARELSEITLQVEQERRQSTGVDRLNQAIADRVDSIDLEYVVPASAPATMTRLRALLDEVDVFCREQRLLTLAATEQHHMLRDWYLGEFGRQARGEAPRPWPGPYRVEERGR